MPKFVYVGPHDAVEINGLVAVRDGEPIDGPPDLKDQPDNWQPVKAAQKDKE